MPLHLLGKKSWNVYNQDNIERVKRDEAAAAAQEAAEEERMQEIDAERRIKILRGEPTDDLDVRTREQVSPLHPTGDDANREERTRKRRRLAGEDDTERDMRFAIENQALSLSRTKTKPLKSKSSDAPLHDRAGHINLFPTEARNASRAQKVGNPEKEAEDAKKKREYEDQYTMRFSNAAGFKHSIGDKPWYSNRTSSGKDEPEAPISKGSQNRDDLRKKERASMRLATDDPLAVIQKGVQGVRKAEKERRRWKEQRLREVDEMIEAERKSMGRHKRHRRPREDEDDLENFSLDAEEPNKRERNHHHKHRHGERDGSHRHSNRSVRRSRSHSPRLHRHRQGLDHA